MHLDLYYYLYVDISLIPSLCQPMADKSLLFLFVHVPQANEEQANQTELIKTFVIIL